MAKLSYSQAIRETIAQEMRRDERVFVMGEDVEKLGGVYGLHPGPLQGIPHGPGPQHPHL